MCFKNDDEEGEMIRERPEHFKHNPEDGNMMV
jgi:hypothetical protein